MIALELGSSLGFRWMWGGAVIQLPLLCGDSITSEKEGVHF